MTEITTTAWYWSPPSAAEYVGLTLDCSNQFLQPSDVTDATFTIQAYENASLGWFTFFLNVTAHYGAAIFTEIFIVDGYIAEPHPTFSVFSDHGSPTPSVGDHTYNSWDNIVFSVAPVVEENGLYWASQATTVQARLKEPVAFGTHFSRYSKTPASPSTGNRFPHSTRL